MRSLIDNSCLGTRRLEIFETHAATPHVRLSGSTPTVASFFNEHPQTRAPCTVTKTKTRISIPYVPFTLPDDESSLSLNQWPVPRLPPLACTMGHLMLSSTIFLQALAWTQSPIAFGASNSSTMRVVPALRALPPAIRRILLGGTIPMPERAFRTPLRGTPTMRLWGRVGSLLFA
jgi:hypothetical protein